MQKKFVVFLVFILSLALLLTGCKTSGKYTDGLSFSLASTAAGNDASVAYYSVSGSGNTDYTSVVIPAIYNKIAVREIAAGAFKNCDELTKVSLNSNINIINASAFLNCTSLKNINLPNKLNYIGVSAFLNTGLVSISIPNSVEVLQFQAFAASSSLKTVSLPASLLTIEELTFSGCISLQSVILPLSLKLIEYKAFENCKALSFITLPAVLEEISDFAFLQAGLRTINIPDKVKLISENAFYDCKNLASITINSKEISVGDNAFYGCDALKTLVLKNESVLNFAAFDFEGKQDFEDFSIKVPSSLLDSYLSADGWSNYAEYITSI